MENGEKYGLEQTTEDRPLFTCRYYFDLREQKKAEKCFHRLFRYQVVSLTYRNMAAFFLISLLLNEPMVTLLLFALIEIILVIGLAIKLNDNLEKQYSKRFDKEREGEFEFYQDYLLLKTEDVTVKTRYARIVRCVETDTNFYLECGRNDPMHVILKEFCDPALASFLREKLNVVEKHVRGVKRAGKGDGAKGTGQKKYRDPDLVHAMLIILLMLTIASLWLCQLVSYKVSVSLIQKYDMVRFSWVYWCFLPIPISSVVLGYKFQREGFKCKKNIIAGYIIGFILAIFGSYWIIFQ